MNIKGLRISDIWGGKCIPLAELLTNISDLSHLNWSLLWFDVTPIENQGRFIIDLTKKVNSSEQGFPCTFESLLEYSKKIFQEIEVLIIGCESQENLHRYKDDQKMYETCSIVIEMIDGGFWEVFSKNANLIDKLSKKYKDIEFLPPDFQNN